jgi:hypothetical protein
LLVLVALKQNTPLEHVGTEADYEATLATLALISRLITEYNMQLQALATTIGVFKTSWQPKTWQH